MESDFLNVKEVFERLISKRKSLDTSHFLMQPIQNMIDCIIGEYILTSSVVKRSIKNVEKKITRDDFILGDESDFVISMSNSYVAPGLGIRIQKKLRDRFELVLQINDDTTIDNIRNNWYQILEIKKFLREIQGTDPYDSEYDILWQIDELKGSGNSYAQIATKVNHLFLLELCQVVCWENEKESSKFAYLGEMMASDILKALMMKTIEIKEWLSISLDEIRHGRVPWDSEYGPVDALRVRDALRLWNYRKQKGLVVPLILPSEHFHDLIGEFRKFEVVEFCNKLEKIR